MASPLRRHHRQRFYKYVTGGTARTILETRSLRWSSPLLFNDPFDVPRDADLGFTDEALRNTVFDVARELLTRPEPPRNPVFAELHRALRQSGAGSAAELVVLRSLRHYVDTRLGPLLEQSRGTFERAWQELLPRLRILCVSEVSDNITMWAHYSDGHKGAVLQLDANDERDSSLLRAQQVVYQAGAPQLPSAAMWAHAILGEADIDWEEFFKEYHYVKTPDWAYEREWRVLTYATETEGELYSDWRFAAPDLSAVFLGEKFPVGEREEFVSLIRSRYPLAEVHQARFDHSARVVLFEQMD